MTDNARAYLYISIYRNSRDEREEEIINVILYRSVIITVLDEYQSPLLYIMLQVRV